ncbi:MAG: AraC family transcriptional regulator [Nocardioidaceae bacterium]
MDDLAALLDGPRARGAFLLRCPMSRPWGIRLQDEAPLTVTAVVRGHAWALPDGGEAVPLAEGDVVVTVGPDHWTVADDPATRPSVVIHPGQHCTTPDGRPLEQEMDRGVRTWGNAALDGAEDLLVTGAYWVEGEVGRRLLGSLPALLVLREAELDSPLVHVLTQEVGRDRPGQEAVLDRLLDLLLIAVLRAWFARPGSLPPRWWAGQTDPVLAPALRVLQHNPAHPWTVAELAGVAGLSRAAFARRFTTVLGEPPMAYLTRWRILLAADLLRGSAATVASVATRVGYGTPFALSAAFKRELGTSPRDYRARTATGAA